MVFVCTFKMQKCCITDGIVLIDKDSLRGRKVFAHVLAAFRYGREDLDVLGLTFRKDLYLANYQVYPPVEDQAKPLTNLQERLIRKLGPNAYPFYFEVKFLRHVQQSEHSQALPKFVLQVQGIWPALALFNTRLVSSEKLFNMFPNFI